jgi:hypothetical protein
MSSTADKKKPLWQQPFLWLGALIVAALGTALTNAMQPLFDRGVSAVTEGGEPVSVRLELQRRTEDVLLPAKIHLTDNDLQMLNGMRRAAEQVDWLASRGGVVAGQRTLMLTLRGERSIPVRITDIRDASECAPPDRGSLFRMVLGRGATPDSTRIGIYVGDPDRDAVWWDSEAEEAKSFFPDKTITLQKAEEEVVLVDLYPQEDRLCRVRLDMTVVDADQKRVQHIDPGLLEVIQVEPAGAEPDYEHVYLSGEICNRAVAAPRNWEWSIPAVCGPGNGLPRSRG